MASNRNAKYEATDFKYVQKVTLKDNSVKYKGLFQVSKMGNKTSNGKFYDTIREAAISVDKFLIGKGKEPVNILVRK